MGSLGTGVWAHSPASPSGLAGLLGYGPAPGAATAAPGAGPWEQCIDAQPHMAMGLGINTGGHTHSIAYLGIRALGILGDSCYYHQEGSQFQGTGSRAGGA